MADRMRQRALARLEGGARPRPAAPLDGEADAILSANRGRAPIKAAPAAGNVAAALLRPLLPQRGLGLSELRRAWREIAGEGVAKAAWPEKLAAGVLTLRAPSAMAPFLQHQAPLILERCRLAGAALKAVRIEQGAPSRPKPSLAPVQRALTAAEEKALADAMGRIEDPALKGALLRLGRAMTRAPR